MEYSPVEQFKLPGQLKAWCMNWRKLDPGKLQPNRVRIQIMYSEAKLIWNLNHPIPFSPHQNVSRKTNRSKSANRSRNYLQSSDLSSRTAARERGRHGGSLPARGRRRRRRCGVLWAFHRIGSVRVLIFMAPLLQICESSLCNQQEPPNSLQPWHQSPEVVGFTGSREHEAATTQHLLT